MAYLFGEKEAIPEETPLKAAETALLPRMPQVVAAQPLVFQQSDAAQAHVLGLVQNCQQMNMDQLQV